MVGYNSSNILHTVNKTLRKSFVVCLRFLIIISFNSPWQLTLWPPVPIIFVLYIVLLARSLSAFKHIEECEIHQYDFKMVHIHFVKSE